MDGTRGRGTGGGDRGEGPGGDAMSGGDAASPGSEIDTADADSGTKTLATPPWRSYCETEVRFQEGGEVVGRWRKAERAASSERWLDWPLGGRAEERIVERDDSAAITIVGDRDLLDNGIPHVSYGWGWGEGLALVEEWTWWRYLFAGPHVGTHVYDEEGVRIRTDYESLASDGSS